MNAGFVIYPADGPWHVGWLDQGQPVVQRLSPPAGAPLAEHADAAAQTLQQAGCAGQPIVLALPSPWCLSARVSAEGLDRRNRRRELTFRLEEHLPLSAEQVVADFVHVGEAQTLGVCAELARLERLVSELESRGLNVRHICPAALLAAENATFQQRGLDAVLLADRLDETAHPDYDWVQLDHGRPSDWAWFAADASATHDRLAAWADGPDRSHVMAVLGGPNGLVMPASLVRADLPAMPPMQAGVMQAGRILRDDASPCVDLRRHPLAAPRAGGSSRRPAIALAGAAALLLVGLAVGMLLRGRSYLAASEEYRRRQAAVFRETLPNQPMPGNICARMVSEQRKATRASRPGAVELTSSANGAPSALVQFRDLLNSLPRPDALRYRIVDLSIQPEMIRVDGEALTLVDADQVAAAVRTAGRFEVESPQTQARGDNGVSFLFVARPRGTAAPPNGSAP